MVDSPVRHNTLFDGDAIVARHHLIKDRGPRSSEGRGNRWWGWRVCVCVCVCVCV